MRTTALDNKLYANSKNVWKRVYLKTRMVLCVCVGIPGGRKVEVQFVDFGNNKILSVNDLRKIKDEFFALPAMVRSHYTRVCWMENK